MAKFLSDNADVLQTVYNLPMSAVCSIRCRIVADGMTGVSFRRLPALLCLHWQAYLR